MRRLLPGLAAVVALGADFSVLRSLGHVSDYAGVVDGRTEAVLNKYCAGVEEAAGVRLELLTIRTLATEPVEDVAKLLARNWGVADDGILMVVAVAERRTHVEAGAELEAAFPEDFESVLLGEMRPALRMEDYGEALLLAAQALGKRVESLKGVAIPPMPARRRGGGGEETWIPWASLSGCIVLAVWLVGIVFVRRKRLKRAAVSPRRSGGGFGEYDSHDRSGGFGGESSRDW
ncbi:MAG: hypothetical protein GY953_16345 [bacterium]|nr:hypothetical protein [bacterium]